MKPLGKLRLTRYCQIAPLSAFAAIKAQRANAPHLTRSNSSIDDGISNSPDESTSHGHLDRLSVEIKVSEVENLTRDPTDLDYDSEAGMTAEMDEDEGDNSDALEALRKEYSSWKPLDNNISETRTGQRIHMIYGQTLAILGQFDLSVLSGVVSISGAYCSSKSPIQRVIAPLTAPLPVIRCASSDGAGLDLLNVPEKENLERLGRVSGLFRDIWSCQCPNCAEMGEKYTFRKVRKCRDTRFINC
jgi:hypothetical protein